MVRARKAPQPSQPPVFTHTLVRLRPCSDLIRPEPVPLEPPTEPQPPPPPRAAYSRIAFIALGVVALLVFLWIVGDIVLKKMAMKILFDGSNLPTATPRQNPTPRTAPSLTGPVRMGSFDLNRDVRVVY